jgi:meiosis induction protein kinase IME2/SME1
MAPHSLDTILVQPTWPAALSDFVTWCLMWDPKNRPNSSQALAHEYFRDAVDPLKRPKSSSKLLSRKHSNIGTLDSNKENSEPTPSLSTKSSSWFRRSLIQREISAPAVTQHAPPVQAAPQPIPLQSTPMDHTNSLKPKPNANKRATWTHGLSGNGAPMLILPSIRPVSPISDAVTAQAHKPQALDSTSTKLASRHNNMDPNQMDIESGLAGHSGLASPTSSHKESFFSHLRKRARRFSGRYPISPNDEMHSNASSSHWQSNRHSQVLSNLPTLPNSNGHAYAELDKALNGARSSWEMPLNGLSSPPAANGKNSYEQNLKRHHSTGSKARVTQNPKVRKAQSKASNPNLQYDTPNEADELLDEALVSARLASNQLDWASDKKQVHNYLTPDRNAPNQYLITPSASANGAGNGATFGTYQTNGKQVEVRYPTQTPHQSTWPTPPYDESEREENWDSMHNWALSTLNSVFTTANTLSPSSQF